jgi:hypothetical protein
MRMIANVFFGGFQRIRLIFQRDIMVCSAEVKAGHICGMTRSLIRAVRSGCQQESMAMAREKAEE